METQTVTIKTKTAGPLRRAGLALGQVGQWVEHELDLSIEGLKKLVMLAEDPAITVLAKDEDGNWHAAPDADELKALLVAKQAEAQSPIQVPRTSTAVAAALGVPTSTMLPTAEPTLEREPQDTTGDEAAEEPQPLAPDPTQNAAGTGGQEIAPAPDAPAEPSTPAPEAPAAQAEGEAKAEPEA